MQQPCHRPVAEGIVAAIQSIFSENRHAEKVVEYHLKNQRRWGSRDRRQFAETVYDLVRWWRKLVVLRGEVWRDAQWLQRSEPIAESFIWDILGLWWQLNDFELPTWRTWYTPESSLQNLWQSIARRADAESIPDWLDQLGEEELGERWAQLLLGLNQRASVYLRANELKNTADELKTKLAALDIATEIVENSAVKLRQRRNVFQTDLYKQGAFEMQDLGSQRISSFMQPNPGERVVDACAGAGGKTLHVASLMQNKGKIIALDIHQWKLNELKQRARRAGCDIVETRLIDSTKVIKRLNEGADRVLLDVPCSGLGVLRRHPDTKWKYSREEHSKIAGLQQSLLNDYSQMVRRGGVLVYATCSVLPSENKKRIDSFLQLSSGRWSLDKEIYCWPDVEDIDGFYAARMIRT